MNKLFRVFFFFAGMVLLGLQACSLEETAICPTEPDTGGQEVPIRFTTKAPVATRTSVTGDEWVIGDSVGIYMLDDVTTQLIANSLNSNRKYTVTSGITKLEDLAADGTQALFYKGSSPLRFISYYPFQRNVTGYTIPLDVRKQDKPEEIDVLYSTNAKKIVEPASPATTPVTLLYRHILSKLIIDVKPGMNTDVNLDGMQGVFENQQLTGGFQLDSNWVTTGTELYGALGFIEIAPQDANYPKSFQAIVMPHNPINNATELIQLRTQRRLYSWKLPPEMTKFEPGMVYHFQLTLLGETNIQFTGKITKWDDSTPDANVSTSEDDTGKSYTRVIRDGLDTLGVRYMKGGGDPFQMGTTLANPSPTDFMPTAPVHKVEFTASYHITEAEITAAQYCKFLNDTANKIVGTVTGAIGNTVNVSHWIPGATSVVLYQQPATGNNTITLSNGKWVPAADGEYPMTCVTWYGAQAYARWAGGNLPTEAQWEFAARDEVGYAYDFLTDAPDYNGKTLAQYANYKTGAVNAPLQPVKSLLPSINYTMYDMFGNVWEWCYDTFSNTNAPYPGITDQLWTDPNDPSKGVSTAANGVSRGGGYLTPGNSEYIGVRWGMAITNLQPFLGFRVVFPFK